MSEPETDMKLAILALLAALLSPSAANAEDLASLQQRVDQLENRIAELSRRLDNLGASSAMREFERSIRYSWAREMQRRALWRWTIQPSIVPRTPS